MLGVGFYASSQFETFKGFATTGGQLPFVIVFFTLFSTYLGPGSTFGWAEQAFTTGVEVLPSIFGYIVFMISMAFIAASRYNRFSKNYDGDTLGDLMEVRFDHKTRAIVSLFQMGSFFAIAASAMRAMGTVLSTVTGLNLIWAIIITSIILIIYTSLGGLFSVAYTDVVQGIISIVGLVMLGITMFNHAGGFAGIQEGYAALNNGPTLELSKVPLGPALTGFLVFFIGSLPFQDITQRCYAAKTAKAAKIAMISFGIVYGFVILSGGFMIGLTGRLLLPSVAADKILAASTMKFLSPLMGSILFMGLLGAAMSTGDSSLIIPTINFTKDFYKRYINQEASDRQMLKLTKYLTAIFGLFAMIIAIMAPGIFDLFFLSCDLLGASAAVPLLIALYWKKPSANSMFVGILSSMVIWFIMHIGDYMLLGLGPVFWASLANFVITWFTNNYMPMKEEKVEVVEEFYNIIASK